jgi:hypothetical protein
MFSPLHLEEHVVRRQSELLQQADRERLAALAARWRHAARRADMTGPIRPQPATRLQATIRNP